jgi:hypothetical protein
MEQKKILVFTLNYDLFCRYSHEQRIKSSKSPHSIYLYAKDREHIMGLSEVDIVLYYGWESINKFNIEQEIILLFRQGSSLVGERECVGNFLWNEWKIIEKNNRKPKKSLIYLTKFDILDI